MLARHRRLERGFAFFVAVVIVLALTFVGLWAVRGSNESLQLAMRSHAAIRAFYVAEAGVAFGLETLRRAPIELAAEDEDERACGEASCPLAGWRVLTTAPRPFGEGTYWVAVHDDADDDGDEGVDSNGRILMRSLGVDSSGARRLIEVVVLARAVRGATVAAPAIEMAGWREVPL